MDRATVRGYECLAPGHIQAALQVKTGAANCCIATRATARSLGLGFLPLVSERYDFVIRKKHLELPSVQTFLDTLSRASFRIVSIEFKQLPDQAVCTDCGW
jgi:putative molybdopterin biosynthesis protein